MLEILMSLGLLTNVASTEIPLPPECDDPQVVQMVLDELDWPEGWTFKVKYTYPTEGPDEEIGLRKCAMNFDLSWVLAPTPQAGTGYYEVQTIGDKFMVRTLKHPDLL